MEHKIDGGDFLQSHKSNYTLYDDNAVFELAVMSVIGDREQQQDSAGYQLKNNEGLVVVCDGMGGHRGGQIAGTLAANSFLTCYTEDYPCSDPHSWLIDIAMEADQLIAGLKDDAGEPLKAGSTVAAAFIRENALFWMSVGDSRIYLFREEQLVRATADHTYRYLLERQLESGAIDEDTYHSKMEQGEALVSFLGVDGLPFIEANDIPFELKSGDRILLMTDGLYKLVFDDAIRNIIGNFENIREALDALEKKAEKCGKQISRDNMTVALIKMK